MGTWGPALFSDDTACDVRNEYRDLIGDGLGGSEATDRMLDAWRLTLVDPDEGPVFWYALADTQWKCGRLDPRVRDHALELIAAGAGLHLWQEKAPAMRKRETVLAKLRDELLSPPPPAKRIAKRFRDSCPWGVGELISYQLQSGSFIILRVISLHTDLGGTCPYCEILDWVGTDVPPKRKLKRIPVRVASMGRPYSKIMLMRRKESELPSHRLVRLGLSLKPAQAPLPCTAILWSVFDEYLARDFGID